MSRGRSLSITVREVLRWLRVRRLGWLSPLVFLLLVMGGLLALAAAFPAASPFVYLLF